MPTLHIKLKVGNAEIEIKADGELDKETLATLKSILSPVTSNLSQNMGEVDSEHQDREPETATKRISNIYAKFRELIVSVFRYGQWFTSLDAKEAFFDMYNMTLKSSTVSTYLRRMEKEDILESKKYGRILKFRVREAVYALAQVPNKNIEELG